MRHRKTRPTLDRKAASRNALLKSLANSFVLHGQIKSSLAKIQAVKPIVEKAITTAKTNDLTSRRKLGKYFSETAVNKLLKDLGPKYKDRKGGYTRKILGARNLGDNSQQAHLELV